ARHALADAIAVVARLLAVEVRFEPVSDRFVEENAAVARGEDDVHLSRRRFARVEHRDRLAHRLRRVPFRALAVEIVPADAASAARGSGLALALGFHDRPHTESQ